MVIFIKHNLASHKLVKENCSTFFVVITKPEIKGFTGGRIKSLPSLSHNWKKLIEL